MGLRDVQARIKAADGLGLYLRGLVPEAPRGSLLFVHGLGEHIGRYADVFEAMAERGWACWGTDLRGHGRSEGARGHVDRFSTYLEDLEAALEFLRVSRPRDPAVLVGHSMGGLIVLRFLQENRTEVAAAVVSSPALAPHEELRPPVWKNALARALSQWWPRVRFATGIDSAHLSRDPRVGREYDSDPLVLRQVTARWYVETLAAGRRVAEGLVRLGIPLLVLQAGADRLVDGDLVATWSRNCSGPLELEIEEGAYHELFQEPDRGERLSRIDRWLEAALASAAVRAAVDPPRAETPEVRADAEAAPEEGAPSEEEPAAVASMALLGRESE